MECSPHGKCASLCLCAVADWTVPRQTAMENSCCSAPLMLELAGSRLGGRLSAGIVVSARWVCHRARGYTASRHAATGVATRWRWGRGRGGAARSGRGVRSRVGLRGRVTSREAEIVPARGDYGNRIRVRGQTPRADRGDLRIGKRARARTPQVQDPSLAANSYSHGA